MLSFSDPTVREIWSGTVSDPIVLKSRFSYVDIFSTSRVLCFIEISGDIRSVHISIRSSFTCKFEGLDPVRKIAIWPARGLFADQFNQVACMVWRA